MKTYLYACMYTCLRVYIDNVMPHHHRSRRDSRGTLQVLQFPSPRWLRRAGFDVPCVPDVPIVDGSQVWLQRGCDRFSVLRNVVLIHGVPGASVPTYGHDQQGAPSNRVFVFGTGIVSHQLVRSRSRPKRTVSAACMGTVVS